MACSALPAAGPLRSRARCRSRQRRGQHRPVASRDARHDSDHRRADGETVKKADVHCGYLHRGFEKEAEHHTYHKVIPYTDRLNYCSALNNNFVYADAVEKLLGIEITPRCKVLRTLLCEYSRIADHMTCVAASVMEMGAMTAFLYLMTARDYIYEHLNHLTGARLTHSYVRIGGLARDLPDGWLDAARGDPAVLRALRRAHPRADGPQSHLHRSHAQCRGDDARARVELGLYRTDPAFHRTAHGLAQGQPLSRVRRAGVRGSSRDQGRQLRPLLRAHVRNRRVDLDDPPVRAPCCPAARSVSTIRA